jgi:hypothetical protein
MPQRPCSQQLRQHGFEPYDKPLDLNGGAGTTLACADLCDEDVGACAQRGQGAENRH